MFVVRRRHHRSGFLRLGRGKILPLVKGNPKMISADAIAFLNICLICVDRRKFADSLEILIQNLGAGGTYDKTARQSKTTTSLGGPER